MNILVATNNPTLSYWCQKLNTLFHINVFKTSARKMLQQSK
jgi:hypothetical protein